MAASAVRYAAYSGDVGIFIRVRIGINTPCLLAVPRAGPAGFTGGAGCGTILVAEGICSSKGSLDRNKLNRVRAPGHSQTMRRLGRRCCFESSQVLWPLKHLYLID